MRIALVKDITKLWTVYKPELEKYGAEVVLLDIFKEKDLERLLTGDWDGLIWRAKHDPYIRDLAKTILYYFDVELGVKTFPSWNSYWNYDNKVAQSFVLKKIKLILLQIVFFTIKRRHYILQKPQTIQLYLKHQQELVAQMFIY